jgi:CheY-like chemotaxis protein
MPNSRFTILLIEDSPNDVLLLKRAFKRVGIENRIINVPDGLEGMFYLVGESKYADRQTYPIPRLIILDLKMPRMTGLEFLAWINDHLEYRAIPTIVLTSSRLKTDVDKVYQLKGNVYMVKPSNPEELDALVKSIHDYWSFALTPGDKTH